MLGLDGEYITARYVQTYSASVRINHATIDAIIPEAFSNGELFNSTICDAYVHDSKFTIENTTFVSEGGFSAYNSIVTIADCLFEYYYYESLSRNSIIRLRGNTIYAEAFLSPINTVSSYLLYEYNNLIFAGEPEDKYNHDGFQVYQDNYAIIRYNTVKGFSQGISIDYTNHAIVYNNTFINNGNGVRVSATPNVVSVFNNIFYNQSIAIGLGYSTYGVGEIYAYVNNNLWWSQNPYRDYAYIDDRKEHSYVFLNTHSIQDTPDFAETEHYTLQAGSPAIDAGTTVIRAFADEFTVLDETIYMDDEIVITHYNGAAPDLGVQEY